MNKLEPCPFCGEIPNEETLINQGPDNPEWWIECINIRCPVVPGLGDSCRATARARWNTRTQPAVEIVRMTNINGGVKMYKIDKNVQIPVNAGRGRAGKYPWNDMQVGDSFFVPGTTRAKIGGSVSVTNKRLAPKHFMGLTVDGGVRIWRDK